MSTQDFRQGRASSDAAPSADASSWVALTDEDRDRAFNTLPDMLEGFMKKWGWLHFAKAIEDICREKNAGTEQDAARYRWLLDTVTEFRRGKLWVHEFVAPLAYGDSPDAAIDAAMAQQVERASQARSASGSPASQGQSQVNKETP